MRRIAVLGCGGSGKSYVARELGRRTRIPVTHLDALHYDSAWKPLPPERFEAVQRDLVARDSWIIDGNYNSTLHVRLTAADTVVFMDTSTLGCLWGVLGRQLRNGAGQNPRTGVYARITAGFVRYVLGYRRRMRPRVLAKLERYAEPQAEVVVLRGRRATAQWLATVGPESAGELRGVPGDQVGAGQAGQEEAGDEERAERDR